MSNSPAAYLEDGRLVVRASSLDRCQRCLVGLALGFTPMTPPEKAVAVFQRGHRVEEEVLAKLWGAGWDITHQQFPVEMPVGERAVIRGHLDGAVHFDNKLSVVLEIKSCAPTSWEAWTRNRWDAWNKWEWQTSIYSHATGLPVHLVAAQVVDGQWTGELDHYTITEPRIPLSRIHARVLEIKRYVDEGRLPAVCSSHDWPCPLYHLCSHPETPPDTDPALDALSEHLDGIRAERKRLEGIEKEIRGRVDELLGDRDKVRTDAWSVTRVETARTTLDRDKLQEAFGDLSAYEKTTISQQLRVSRRKDGGRGGSTETTAPPTPALSPNSGEDRGESGDGTVQRVLDMDGELSDSTAGEEEDPAGA